MLDKNLEEYLYKEVKKALNDMDFMDDLFMISFFVYCNECFIYEKYENLTEFAVELVSESSVEGSEFDAEDRWNYAMFASDKETWIVSSSGNGKTAYQNLETVVKSYKDRGIENPGYEDRENNYESFGFVDMCNMASNIAKRLHEEKYITSRIGREAIILVHDLEYTEPTYHATINANDGLNLVGYLSYMQDSIPYFKKNYDY